MIALTSARAVVLNAVGDRYSRPPFARGRPRLPSGYQRSEVLTASVTAGLP
jgi:hypothetical protein